MKLSPPASSSDLDAAREIARRLHQRRRREDRPYGNPHVPGDEELPSLVPPPLPPSAAPAQAPPRSIPRAEPPLRAAAAEPPLRPAPAAEPPPRPAPPAEPPRPSIPVAPEPLTPSSWDEPGGPDAPALDALDALAGIGEPAGPAEPTVDVDVGDVDVGDVDMDVGEVNVGDGDVGDLAADEPPVSPEEMVGIPEAPGLEDLAGGEPIPPSPFDVDLDEGPVEDMVEVPSGPSWDEIVVACLDLSKARGAMLIDPAGQVFAARGEWPDPGPDAIAAKLVSTLNKTLKDAPTRAISAPLMGKQLTAWRVRLADGLVTAAFIGDAPVAADARPAIDAEIHRGPGA
jgi:hypothetical protein